MSSLYELPALIILKRLETNKLRANVTICSRNSACAGSKILVKRTVSVTKLNISVVPSKPAALCFVV